MPAAGGERDAATADGGENDGGLCGGHLGQRGLEHGTSPRLGGNRKMGVPEGHHSGLLAGQFAAPGGGRRRGEQVGEPAGSDS
jgi:hypothetical protein